MNNVDSKIYVGIDPGLKGAIAAITDAGAVLGVFDMPTAKDGKKTVIDSFRLGQALAPALGVSFSEETGFGLPPGKTFVAVEKVGGMPRQSAPAAFNFGMGYGMIRAFLVAGGLPHELITPQRWKKTMLEGQPKDKDASRLLASRLFPSIQNQLRLKKHDGRAESLLLAEYARRQGL